MLQATQALAVKAVNPGGISAFKFNGRELGLDSAGPHYGVTPRRIVPRWRSAVRELGVAHPLHLHCNNLGVPGNLDTTLQTIGAARACRCISPMCSSTATAPRATGNSPPAPPRSPRPSTATSNISVDVGQIMFGQTITASGDTMTQYRNRGFAKPRKWVCMDIECQGGCGLVPFRYRDRNFVNALQWAIGLELFLLVEDPWRIFLTTDHPNGAPFTTYPHLIRLLMDRDFRNDMLRSINQAAAAASTLAQHRRANTRCRRSPSSPAPAPARILGLADRGHLGAGRRGRHRRLHRAGRQGRDVRAGRTTSSRTAGWSCATAG